MHLGCGDGSFTASLRPNDRYTVFGLDTNASKVQTARLHIRSRGLYGPVSVDHLTGDQLPFIDNLVDLVVAEKLGTVTTAEILRVLRPGGVSMVKNGSAWTKTAKPLSKQLDEWTHVLHAGDNNPVANDQVVGPPKQLQWMCGPAWSKHHERYPPTIPMLVSAAARLFYFEEATPPCIFNVKTGWSLKARGAFNGTLLWQRTVPDWEPTAWPGSMGGGLSGGPGDYRRRLVAAGDRIYVTLGWTAPVAALDAATGETIRTYEGTGSTFTEIVHQDGSLFVAQLIYRASGHRITRFETASGHKRWEAAGGQGIAVADGRVLFIKGEKIGALDAATGTTLWTTTPLPGIKKSAGKNRRGRPVRARLQGPLRTGGGVVLACPGARGSIVALSVADGRRLWTFQNRGFRPFFRPVTAWIIDGLVWVTDQGTPAGAIDDDYFALGLDPLTGAVRKKVPCGAVWNCGHHQRCYPTKATAKFLIFSRRGAEFLNLANGDVGLNNWTRGTCGYGIMPANGLLYAPPHACRCYSETALRGLCALAPAGRGPRLEKPAPEAARLQRGPAYGHADTSAGRPVTAGDWPTFRHDPARSGSTPTAVAPTVKPQWRVTLGGKLTQPVAASGCVFIASIDTHTVHALDADTGAALWTYTAGGRIDTPPTVHEGLALFGSADGWVYCLRADDGKLVWRFRAAPHDLRMGDDGQIASVWPVHGSVLVRDDVAYFAAGRCSFVDDGIRVYGLEAATGRKLFEHHCEGPDTGAGFTRENPGRGFVMPGALPDVLVASDRRIYMRHLVFDGELENVTDMAPNFYPAPKRSGEEFGGDHKFWCDLLEVGPCAFVGKPEWNHRSYFNNFPGRRLYSTTGLLDDSWHIRSYWSYGQIVGQYLVFNGDRGYAVQAYPNAARWASYQAGDGYLLYAGKTAVPKPDQRLYALTAPDRDWQIKLPFRPIAMVLAGPTLFLAGPPDVADPAEALAALQGKRGATLRAVDAAGGRLLIAGRDGTLICCK